MTTDPQRDLEGLQQDLQDAVDDGHDDAAEVLEEVSAYLDADQPTPEQHHGLREQLGDAVLHFEVSHPRLSSAVQQALDSLTASGI